MNNRWIDVLQDAVARSSAREVSERLGYSRTTVSLVLSGKYRGKTDKVEERVMTVYGAVSCPYLDKVITPETCRTFSLGKAPTHNPIKMEHWRACLRCPHRPEEKSRENDF